MSVNARKYLPKEEYDARISRIQEAMKKEDIDVLIVHRCECESQNIRYIADVWTVFDFIGGVIPKEGDAILLTGGPESYDLVKEISCVPDVRVHPFYVESNNPVWDMPTDPYTYKKVFQDFKFPIKKIAIANSNIFPDKILKDVEAAAPEAKFVNGDEIMMKAHWYKSTREVDVLREAYRITDEAARKTIPMIRPGVAEWEIEAEWRSHAYKMGAEGVSYPIWITSYPTTYQSLCRSTERKITDNDMVQLTVGAKFNGYCGNLCRPIILGKIPEKHMDMIRVAQECLVETKEIMKPGIPFAQVYDAFQARLGKNGYGNMSLYGPAHGTGLSECEGPWVDNRTDMIVKPNMTFNIDIWITDGQYGVRFEDGIAVNEKGIESLTSFAPEPIYI